MAYKGKRQEITIPYGTRSKLAKSFGVKPDTVTTALRFNSNSQLANDIRERAIKMFGGKLATITVENIN